MRIKKTILNLMNIITATLISSLTIVPMFLFFSILEGEFIFEQIILVSIVAIPGAFNTILIFILPIHFLLKKLKLNNSVAYGIAGFSVFFIMDPNGMTIGMIGAVLAMTFRESMEMVE